MNYQAAMIEAIKVSKRSMDPVTKVGVCIVDPTGAVVSSGFNRLAPGVDKDKLRLQKPLKNHYMLHAELIALLHAKVDLAGHTLITTLYPCHYCASAIIEAGIKSVVYCNERENTISAQLFSEAKVDVIKLGVPV